MPRGRFVAMDGNWFVQANPWTQGGSVNNADKQRESTWIMVACEYLLGGVNNTNVLGHLLHRIATLILITGPAILSIVPYISGECAEKRSVPNIVLILTDDQGFGELGATGNPLIRTPHMDRLAGQSVG